MACDNVMSDQSGRQFIVQIGDTGTGICLFISPAAYFVTGFSTTRAGGERQ